MRKQLKPKHYRNTRKLDLKVLTPEFSHMSVVTTDPHEIFTRVQWLASQKTKIELKIGGKISRLTRDFNEGKLTGDEIIGRLSAWKEYYRQVREFFGVPCSAEHRVEIMLRIEQDFLAGRRAGNVPRHPLRKYQGFNLRQIQQLANEKVNRANRVASDAVNARTVANLERNTMRQQLEAATAFSRRVLHSAGQALALASGNQAWIVVSPTYATEFWLTDDPFALQSGLMDLVDQSEGKPFLILQFEPTAGTPYVNGEYMSPAFAAITADLALMTEREDIMVALKRQAEPAAA